MHSGTIQSENYSGSEFSEQNADLARKTSGITPRHRDLITAINFLPWRQKVSAIKEAVRCPLNNDSEIIGEAPHDSIIKELGRQTMHSFITSSIEDGGLGMPWDEWQKMEKADRIADQYAIDGSADSILEQSAKVAELLGRQASDATEFHRVAKIVSREETNEILKTNEREKQSLVRKIDILTRQLDEVQAQFNQAQEQHERVLAAVDSASEKELQRALAIAEQYKAEIAEYASRIEFLESKINEMASHMAEADDAIVQSENFRREARRASQDNNEMRIELSQAKSAMSELEENIASLQEELNSAYATVDDLNSENAELKSGIENLSGEVASLKETLEKAVAIKDKYMKGKETIATMEAYAKENENNFMQQMLMMQGLLAKSRTNAKIWMGVAALFAVTSAVFLVAF